MFGYELYKNSVNTAIPCVYESYGFCGSSHGVELISMAGQEQELGKAGHAKDGMMVWRMLNLF